MVNALIGAGLRIERLDEYDYSPFGCFGFLVESSPGRWSIRSHESGLPLSWSLRATHA